jgi:2-dehydropantoate 2-reductase
MGLGGIGGIVSAHLLEQSVEVVAVTTNQRIAEAIERSGFWLSGDGDTRIVPGHAFPAPPPYRIFDVILLATQPPQVEEAALTAAPVLADDGLMVCFQNGLVEPRVAKIVGDRRVVGGVVAWGASMVGPGRYERTSAGGFTLGRLEGPPDAKLRALGNLLECIGPVEYTTNLRGARWSKLAINAAISTLGAIGGDRLGTLLAHRFVRRLALEIMTETVEVARLEGVRLEKVSGTLDLDWLALTPEERRSAASASLITKHSILLAVGARYRRLRSSMLAAIERGRKPAVDFLNGEVIQAAEKHQHSVPVNRRASEMVHAIAFGEVRSSLELLRRLYEETRGPS